MNGKMFENVETNLGTGRPLSACNWTGKTVIKVPMSNAKNRFVGPLTKPGAIIVWFSCCMLKWRSEFGDHYRLCILS